MIDVRDAEIISAGKISFLSDVFCWHGSNFCARKVIECLDAEIISAGRFVS